MSKRTPTPRGSARGGKPRATPKRKDKRAAPNRDLFVVEYLKDGNATQAAIRAGYSARSARSTGARLLANDDIAAAVAEGQAKLAEEAEVEAATIMAEVDILAIGDIGAVLDFSGDQVRLRPAHQIDAAGRKLLSAMKVRRTFEKGPDGFEPVEVIEFKLWDKLAALRLALQRRGLAIQKHEHTGKDGGPIESVAKMVYTMPANGR